MYLSKFVNIYIDGECDLFDLQLQCKIKITKTSINTNLKATAIDLRKLLHHIQFYECAKFVNKIKNISIVDGHFEYQLRRDNLNQNQPAKWLKLYGKLKSDNIFKLFLDGLNVMDIINLISMKFSFQSISIQSLNPSLPISIDLINTTKTIKQSMNPIQVIQDLYPKYETNLFSLYQRYTKDFQIIQIK